MSPIMKKISIAAASILVCVAAAAQGHQHHQMSDAEFLKMLGEMSTVGTKSTVATGVTVTVNMTAKSFDFTPSSITVNQGDTLVINLSVPLSDPAKKGHGLLMETYLEDGVNVNKGTTSTITIQAVQDGIFVFGCNVSDCGDGHSNMIGTLTVKKITNPAPSVAQIAPTTGSTTGGTSVTINGANFQSNATVTFGGVAATSVSVTSSTSIVAVTPPSASAGAVPVVVRNGDGQSVSFSSFSYTLPAPSINSVSPATGPTSGGTTFTVSGNGFVSGATVTVGGRPAGQINFVNATTMTALSPLGPASGETPLLTQDVVVTNPDGTRITKAGGFTYVLPALSISSVSPNAGLPAGGADVTINGVGFNSALASSVTFGGVAATNVRVIDAVTMRVTAPAHAAGSVDVVVNDGATVTVTNGYTYGTPVPRKRSAKH
jgi:plastocyanin